MIPAVILDSHKAELYAQIFEHLTVHDDLAINEGGEIAWAIRKGSPQLMDATNAFVAKARKGTELGNILYRRWIADPTRVMNAIAPGEDAKFVETIGFIRRHATAYDFDPVLIAAQGYQESRLDQSERSAAGAIGIMQLMPATARDPNVGIPDIEVAERNVEAGVKYLRHLRDAYFSDPAVTPFDQACFAFAAYNAGPGNIRKARARAASMGLDPNVWFGHVEVAAGRTISREPVVYVRNILKYYTSYQIFQARRRPARVPTLADSGDSGGPRPAGDPRTGSDSAMPPPDVPLAGRSRTLPGVPPAAQPISDLASDRALSAAARIELQRGREAYHRRAWTDAHAILSRHRPGTPLGAEDLERLAMSAYLTNRDDDCLPALERCHHAYLDRGEPRAGRARRVLAWLPPRQLEGRSGLRPAGSPAASGSWIAWPPTASNAATFWCRASSSSSPKATGTAPSRRRQRRPRSEGASRTPIWSPARCICKGAR